MNKAETNDEDKSTTSRVNDSSNDLTLPLFQRVKRYIAKNKKWVFGGIGVWILSNIFSIVRYVILPRDGTLSERDLYDLAITAACLAFLGLFVTVAPLVLAVLSVIKRKPKSGVVNVYHAHEEVMRTVPAENSDLHTSRTHTHVSTSMEIDVGQIFAIVLIIAGYVGVIFLVYKYWSTLLAILGLVILAGGSSNTNPRRKSRLKGKKTKKKRSHKKMVKKSRR